MQLTKYTDYAMRVLIYLGRKDDEPATMGEIAKVYGISKEHLRKIIHHMGKLGFIETTRGRGGGLRLAKAPENIRVGAVVRAMEDSWAIVECLGSGSLCQIDGVCRLKGMVSNARDAFLQSLDEHTLADILQPKKQLDERLQIAI